MADKVWFVRGTKLFRWGVLVKAPNEAQALNDAGTAVQRSIINLERDGVTAESTAVVALATEIKIGDD